MASWLMFIGSFVVIMILATFFMWVGDVAFTNEQFNDICKLAIERERIKNLIDDSEIYETIAKVDKLKMKVEPIEIAQPVNKPSPADLVIETAKENKW